MGQTEDTAVTDVLPKHTMTIYAHELPEDAEQVRTAMGKIG